MRTHTNERLKGALDLLVLKTLASGSWMYEYAITMRIEEISESVLHLEEGSLYPALHRMTQVGWLGSQWASQKTVGALATIPSPRLAAGSWRRRRKNGHS
jgi:DNA-binding PadR family transcriptional regulator